MLALWHWHVEISSKCTLRCPRCARQEVPDSLVNTELGLDFFMRNFTPDFIDKNVKKITFCGDDGDPIYAHDLVPVIRYFKAVKPDIEIVIVTNGSHRKSTWWTSLGLALGENDSVHFSVDGYNQYSNNLYRVNSDWDSIMGGIKTLKQTSRCQLTWAAIAFEFNQDHIEEMKAQAQSLGVDRFQLTLSTKFGKVYEGYGANDLLQPRDELVSSNHRFQRVITDFTGRKAPVHHVNMQLYKNAAEISSVKPLCSIGNKGMYIDAQGRFFPCCWVANRYTHNQEWQDLGTQFNLNKITLEQALQDPFWQTDFQTFRWMECKTKCSSGTVTQEYATEW